MNDRKRGVESSEESTLIRDNQRMLSLLERVIEVVDSGSHLNSKEGLMRAIKITVDKVANPPLATDEDGNYTQAIRLRGMGGRFSLAGMEIVVSPDIPDNEIWLCMQACTKLLHKASEIDKKIEDKAING